MTREEAIKIFQAMKKIMSIPNSDATGTIEAIDIAIEALQAEPVRHGKLNNLDDSLLTTDPEACKEQKSKLDLISRREAIEAVVCHIWHTPAEMRKLFNCENYVREVVEKALESLPSAELHWGHEHGKRIDYDGTWTYTLDEVAEILNDLMGECACNYNGIDEWLPQSCKYADTQCPRPKEKHGCWKQFLLQGAYVKGKDF